MALVAGVDSSTQSTKVVVVDADDGTIVAEGRARHTVTGTAGARESDPEEWFRALGEALASTGRAAEVRALSVGAQQHGLVVLDDHARPLRDAKLWNDTESAPQARALVEAFDGPEWWATEVGVVPVASFTASKWAWLRDNEPEVASATTTACLPHDYLNLRLTGEATTDRGDASGTAWFSTHHDRYLEEVLDHLELDASMLPDVRPAHVGEVSADAAAELGLRAGTPVAAGTGDNAAAAMGLGVAAGEPVVSLGTSGTAFCVSDVPITDPSGVVAGFADATDAWLPLAAVLNCTLAVDRVASLLGIDRDDVADDTDVVVLPYLDGERTPDLPHARGSVVGLDHDTTAPEILWATYLGAAWSLVQALDRIAALTGAIDPAAPITVVGGGARGAAWRRALGVLSGRALRLPAARELVALGAAAQAASLTTDGDPYDVAIDWPGATAEVIPPLDLHRGIRARQDMVGEALETLNLTPTPW